MKFSTYTPGVGLNTVNAKVTVPGDALSYGGGAGYAALGKGLRGLSLEIEKQNDEEDRMNILNAMDIYNKGRYNIMYNEDTGLMNTQAEGSAGISGSYIEQEKKLRGDIMGNIKLHSDRNRLALNHMMNQSAMQGYQTVDRHQYKEGERVKDITLANNIQNGIEYVQKNYNSIGDVLDNVGLLVGARYGDAGPELTEQAVRKAYSNVVGAAISSALMQEDYDGAQRLQEEYGHFLTPGQREEYSKIAYDKERGNWERSVADQLVAQYGEDTDAIEKALDNMNGFTMRDTNVDFETLVNAIGGQESGGDYNAVNGRTGASGKYQIMPENWPSWSQEAGLPAGATMTAENQEQVARFKLRQYYDKYGARGAAIAWYAGEGALSYSADALNRKQGNGDEPSINEYADSVLSRAGAGRTPQPMGYESKDRILRYVTQKQNSIHRQKVKTQNKLYNDFSLQVYENMVNGTSYESAMANARAAAGNNIEALATYTKTVDTWYNAYNRSGGGGLGSGSSGGKGSGNAIIDVSKELLRNGVFEKEEDYIQFLAKQGANAGQLFKAHSTWEQFDTSTGEFKYDFGSLKNIVMGAAPSDEQAKAVYERQWLGAKMAAGYKISEFINREKRQPSTNEVINMLQESATGQAIGTYEARGTWINSNEVLNLSPGEMVIGGIRNVQPIGDDLYVVNFTDGRGTVQTNAAGVKMLADGNRERKRREEQQRMSGFHW